MAFFHFDPRMKDLHGSAHIYTELAEGGETAVDEYFTAPYGSRSILLALDPRNGRRGTWWHMHEHKTHKLLFAVSQTGKGVRYIIPALLGYGGSMLVVDPKGENAWVTAERRRRMGHRVVLLDPWGEVNRKYGRKVGITEIVSKWNPLTSLDPTGPNFADDIALLADALILKSGSETPHWPDSARELVGGLIAAVVERAPGAASLNKMREMLTADNDSLVEAIRIIVEGRPNSLAARKLARFLTSTDEINSIRSTAQTQTAVLDSFALMASLSSETNAFNLADLGRTRATLYLVLPVDKLATHGRWLRLLITMAITAISRLDTPPDPPCVFLLDELGTINPGDGIPAVERSMGLLAAGGIRIWGIFQDLNQLQTDYPRSWRTFLANSSVIGLIGVNDVETAEYFSKHIGTKTVKYNDEGATGRAAIMPQEIMAMKKSQTLLLYQGGTNMMLHQTPYFAEPRWQGVYRPNPLYQGSSPPVSAPVQTHVPPVDWSKVAELGKKGIATGTAAASAAAAFASGWVKDQKRKRKQVRSDAARISGDTSERERWAQTLRDAKGPNDP